MEALAILGGRPVNEKLPEFLAWPVPRDAERRALQRVLDSGDNALDRPLVNSTGEPRDCTCEQNAEHKREESRQKRSSDDGRTDSSPCEGSSRDDNQQETHRATLAG